MDKIAWFGFQTNLEKRRLLEEYLPHYEVGKKPTNKEIEYIFDCELKQTGFNELIKSSKNVLSLLSNLNEPSTELFGAIGKLQNVLNRINETTKNKG